MKVLFLSITAGQGHHATARALMEMLESMGAECRMLDTYAYVNPVLYSTVKRGYLFTTAVTPGTYGRFYRLAELKDKQTSRHSVSNIANSLLSLKLQKYFHEEFDPDVIVCTHVFSAQIVNVMKKSGHIRAATIGIVTDYTIHPYWPDADCIDYIVTASELLTHQAVKKGIPEKKILPLGIPIQPKFGRRISKEEARRQLRIGTDKFTILVMSGSMGHGNMIQVIRSIDSLEHDFQILAVCGNNRRAERKIAQMETRNKVYTYGYVDNVEVMMDAADCIVTKPGGLTSSEALAKHLPIVMVNPIPGQEERNVEFMLNNGLAVHVTDTYPIDEAIYQLFLYPEKLENMVRNIRLAGKPNATRDLCRFVLKLGERGG